MTICRPISTQLIKAKKSLASAEPAAKQEETGTV